VSLREEWYAARIQRQQEVRERQQHVLEYRQQIQAEMAALHEYQRTMLSNFHSTLQAEVAAFLEETRLHQQEVWIEQQQQRAAYVAALQDYVWGTTPTPANGRITTPTGVMQGS
jgi:type II secretory pathway pseudopilin PulG